VGQAIIAAMGSSSSTCRLPSPAVNLINWHWLEDLLVRACELEIREFARLHPDERFFAFCLEFDGLECDLRLSFGTHRAVERALRRAQGDSDSPVYYRAIELRPRHWDYARQPLRDPEGAWEPARPLLARCRENMAETDEPEAVEFLWLRFEYLAECVVARLMDRGAFRFLDTEAEFLAFAANENEMLEEMEIRLAKLYPRYRPATAELVSSPRVGELPPRRCRSLTCKSSPRPAAVARCTYCQAWLCEGCGATHLHPELLARRPFFGDPAEAL
jgi:hypothetical protein